MSVAPAPPEAPLAFSIEGVPGPWWKEGAEREQFDRESRVCLDRSSEARTLATGTDPADAAYRAFLDCMAELAWTRGMPPPPSRS